MTSTTDASWPDKLDAWMEQHDPRVHVIKKEYAAGPFPRLNWFKNRRLAKGLVAELMEFQGGAADCATPIWLVAHSNGALIALEAMRRLVVEGIKVRGLFLTGAACESDVERNGVAGAMQAGLLDRAVSWSSAEDGVVKCDGLWRFLKWPYGDLGREGWQLGGRPFATWKVYTLWRRGGHNVYFARNNLEETFRMILSTIQEGEVNP